uniref:Immunoglobulin domain-containing protein n=1 Tax=Poecilia latipinna TaxID=48699 RepID=A0A3B3UMH4_9TELE
MLNDDPYYSLASICINITLIYTFKCLQNNLILSCFPTGLSVGQKIVSESPVQVYLGENATLEILVENEPSNIITWNFKGGNQIVNVALLRPEGLIVNDRYKGRASIDSANGHLTLTSVQLNDSGNYTVVILGKNTTEIGTVKLHVVGETFIYCF